MLQGVINNRELFDIVDRDDNLLEVGVAEEHLHINDDITRVVTAYVYDNAGKFYIAQRSPNKVVDPLMFEAPAHGRVNSGETYEYAIERETMEELGVKISDLEEIDHFYFSFDTNAGLRQHCKKLFIGKITGEINFDTDEIISMKQFDNFQDFSDYYEKNKSDFSNALEFDMERLNNYITKKK